MTIDELADKVDEMDVEIRALSTKLTAISAIIEHIQKLIVDEVL